MTSKSIKRSFKKRTNNKRTSNKRTSNKRNSERTLKGGNSENVEGYCLKCRSKRIMTNVRNVTNKRGYPMKKGNCPMCGTVMGRFLKRN